MGSFAGHHSDYHRHEEQDKQSPKVLGGTVSGWSRESPQALPTESLGQRARAAVLRRVPPQPPAFKVAAPLLSGKNVKDELIHAKDSPCLPMT